MVVDNVGFCIFGWIFSFGGGRLWFFGFCLGNGCVCGVIECWYWYEVVGWY